MQRLKTRPQFQAVLNGALIAKTSHFALHRLELLMAPPEVQILFPLNTTWLGAMAPKRWAKRAVTRNAIKRQIYTVSASFTSPLPQAALLVRLRREFTRKDFVSATSVALKEAVRTELVLLMQSALATKNFMLANA